MHKHIREQPLVQPHLLHILGVVAWEVEVASWGIDGIHLYEQA